MVPDDNRTERRPGWDAESLHDPHTRHDKAERVQEMFNAVAGAYERINRLATFGRDGVWRRRAVAAADVHPTDVVLDVACGTGDMIRAFARARPSPARIIGVDFAHEMLACGDYAGIPTPIELIEADALALPLPDDSVDVISCAFGVRNFQHIQAGLQEMYRVARPGARLVILEFATPPNRLIRWAYQAYSNAVLPRLGRLLAHDQVAAYRYLPKSVQTFESPKSLVLRLRDLGFAHVLLRPMNFGGVLLYRAHKPARAEGR